MEEYFRKEAQLTAQTIAELKKEGGFVFTLLADSHLNPTREQSVKKYEHTLENIAAVHKMADIDAIFHLGDIIFVNGSTVTSEYWTWERYHAVEQQLKDTLLACNPESFFVAGNHDGPGAIPAQPQQWYENMIAFHGDRVSSVKDEGYYFVDFPEYRVRAICLMDTMRVDDEVFYGYQPDQLSWLARQALDIPEGYKVLLFSHITLHNGKQSNEIVNRQELEGLLTAFQKKAVYQGELVQADFTGRKEGEISAIFGGHGHVQWSGFTENLPFRVVETPCNMVHMPHHSTSWNLTPGFVPAEREMGTVTEDLWDTVVFDTKNNCLHMVRFGSGEDITYAL